MTKKRVEHDALVECPFCGYKVHTGNIFQYCANCLVEYQFSRDGDWIVFDNQRKSQKYFWAKVFARAGGVRMCERIKKGGVNAQNKDVD